MHTALPRQQWLRERTSMSRYLYIACLVHYDHKHVPCLFRRAVAQAVNRQGSLSA